MTDTPTPTPTPSARKLERMEAIIWVLIYGGLIAIVFGLVIRGTSVGASWSLGIAGAAVIAVGVVMIWMRSRMKSNGGGK